LATEYLKQNVAYLRTKWLNIYYSSRVGRCLVFGVPNTPCIYRLMLCSAFFVITVNNIVQLTVIVQNYWHFYILLKQNCC